MHSVLNDEHVSRAGVLHKSLKEGPALLGALWILLESFRLRELLLVTHKDHSFEFHLKKINVNGSIH